MKQEPGTDNFKEEYNQYNNAFINSASFSRDERNENYSKQLNR